MALYVGSQLVGEGGRPRQSPPWLMTANPLDIRQD